MAERAEKLRTDFYRVGAAGFAGYVVDEADPTCRFVVELLLDGWPVRLARADSYVDTLARAGLGDGCYGFAFNLPAASLESGVTAEARLANRATPVGSPIVLDAADQNEPAEDAGDVQWAGGLRFEGWCRAGDEGAAAVTALIEGQAVAQAQATRWTHVNRGVDAGGQARAVRGFDLHLPERFADGRVRQVRFVGANGEDIARPLTFVAFADGLERTLAQLGELESERLRGKLFDALLPAALPFTDYAHWRERFPPDPEVGEAGSVAIVLVGPGDENASLASLKTQQHAEWVAAALPALPEAAAFEVAQLQAFLAEDGAACELVLFAPAGTRLADGALARLTSAFRRFPDAVAAYADFDLEDRAGNPWPIALPAFDYERMLEQGYCAFLFALTRAAAESAARAGAADLFRLFNFTLDKALDQKIIHLPGALATLPPIDVASASQSLQEATAAHLRARGIRAEITTSSGSLFPAVRVARASRRASVAIVIPVRNRAELLRACLQSIAPSAAETRAEIMVVDNDSSDPEMLQYLEEIDGRQALVVRVAGPFNFARLNNVAAEKAHADHLCLINNDVQALDRGWLGEMLGRIAEPDVGAVGALLVWPSGVVQHGGVVLGPNFAAAHAFNDRIQRDPGYTDLLRVAHECSAVTAACLLTRRSDYLAVGGMNELAFPVNFNDVDYCLKLRAAGKRIVLTPHARLRHLESASRGADATPDRASRFAHELRALRARWGEHLAADPYYSPLLSLDRIPYSALAWPPRDRAARAQGAPPPADIPPGF